MDDGTPQPLQRDAASPELAAFDDAVDAASSSTEAALRRQVAELQTENRRLARENEKLTAANTELLTRRVRTPVRGQMSEGFMARNTASASRRTPRGSCSHTPPSGSRPGTAPAAKSSGSRLSMSASRRLSMGTTEGDRRDGRRMRTAALAALATSRTSMSPMSKSSSPAVQEVLLLSGKDSPLDGISADWRVRVDAMSTLREQASELSGLEPHEMTRCLSAARIGLSEQLKDKRSAIVREACDTITELVQWCAENAETLVAFLLPDLLALTYVRSKPFSEASSGCFLSILRNMEISQRTLNKLHSVCTTDRHDELRRVAIEGVQTLIEKDTAAATKSAVVERGTEQLEEAMLKCIEDADESVRSQARQCFFAFHARWEERAMGLLDGPPLSIDKRRYLKEELEQYLHESGDLQT